MNLSYLLILLLASTCQSKMRFKSNGQILDDIDIKRRNFTSRRKIRESQNQFNSNSILLSQINGSFSIMTSDTNRAFSCSQLIDIGQEDPDMEIPYGVTREEVVGAADYNHTCLPYDDIIPILRKLPLGKSKNYIEEFKANLTCNSRKYLECHLNDVIIQNQLSYYTCGCSSQIGRRSYNETIKACYIPYGELVPFNCELTHDENGDVVDDYRREVQGEKKLKCQHGLVCRKRNKKSNPKCICPMGFEYDFNSSSCQHRPGYYTASQVSRTCMATVLIIIAYATFITIFCSDEDLSRLTGFRKKHKCVDPKLVQDIQIYAEPPRLIFQHGQNEFEVDDDD